VTSRDATTAPVLGEITREPSEFVTDEIVPEDPLMIPRMRPFASTVTIGFVNTPVDVPVLASVSAPALSSVASPERDTAVAMFDPFPTQSLPEASVFVIASDGRSAATSERNVGLLAPPVAGPANTMFADCVASVAESVPAPVTGEPETLKIDGSERPTEVTVPEPDPEATATHPRALFPFVSVIALNICPMFAAAIAGTMTAQFPFTVVAHFVAALRTPSAEVSVTVTSQALGVLLFRFETKRYVVV
jgi:hypothetical protein